MRLLSVNSAELQNLLGQHHIYQDPFKRVNWLRLNVEDYWLPEQALSLYGLPQYNDVSEVQRKLLSRIEFLHFLEAGVWLEGLFMERLSRCAGYAKDNIELLKFHLNELREEAGHSLVFIEIIQRSGLPRVQIRFHKLRWLNWLARNAPIDSLLFWLTVMMGEEIPDRVNRVIRQHQSSVCPAIYDIATFHTIDEARHINFTRRLVDSGARKISRFKTALLKNILQRLFDEFVNSYFYPQPSSYEMADLAPGTAWAHLARTNSNRERFVHKQVVGVLRNLRELGIPLTWRPPKP